MLTIGELLTHNARNIPHDEAFVFGTQRIDWAQTNEGVNRLANGLLAHGIGTGAHVVVLSPNNLELVQIYYALAKIGAVAVPMMPRSVAREIRHVVADVEATAIIAAAAPSAQVVEALGDADPQILAIGFGDEHALAHRLEDLIAEGSASEPGIVVDPDSIYSIQYTSGTTGAPKGCMLTHRAKATSRLSMLAHVGYRQQDRALLFMPLVASLGADMLHTHVLRGMTTVLLDGFDEQLMLRLIAEERISAIYALESTFDRLISHEQAESVDWSGLRFFFATSATHDLAPGVIRLRSLPNFSATIWSAYGCTEGGGWLTHLDCDDLPHPTAAGPNHPGFRSIGKECLLAEVDAVADSGERSGVDEPGEMTLRAPWLFSGYWNLPDKTAEALKDGAYFTGDVARRDAEGYVTLEGRMKDMIKTGGLNVYPAEIEMVLQEHDSVREAVVVGVPDAKWGEKIIACVIPDGSADAEELTEYCRRELSGYKIPKSFVFLEDYPRDQVGKILKRELRDRFAGAQ